MAWRPSKAIRNYLLEGGALKHALSNCVISLYSGSQPATPEAAPTGTLLCTYSLSSGALTREVLSTGSVELTGGASGSVDTLTVNSIAILPAAVSFNTSLAQTAADVATAINNNPANHLFDAVVLAGSTITIRAKRGLGALANAWVVASTVTTITKVDVNMAGGTSAVNGLRWGDAADGALVKHPDQVWSGVAAATGAAGWFRIEAAVNDADGVDSTESIIRVDGAVATSGAELNMTPTSITSGATQTISNFTVTLPTA